jgi:hypothetical protein
MTALGELIVFKLATSNDHSTMKKFCRRFYGYLDRSHNYKYTYERRGFLDDFPHLKLQRGVIVVRKQDAKEVISFLESYHAEIFARDLVLTEEDLLTMDQKIG